MMLERSSQSTGMRIFHMVPILGYLLRCIDEERPEELLLLIANFLMVAVFGIMIWGYPALIALFLVMAGLTLMFVLYMTWE